ncbi:MAG: sulfatase [Alphaproteobacteria bacterium]|nr:sulfatase [Alphaproteobacteria bacterium]
MRWRAPTAGMAVGLGLSVAECSLVLRNLLRGFGSGGVVPIALPVVAVYLLFGAAADLLVQAVAPARHRHRRLLRGGAAALTAYVLGVTSGQLLFSLTLVMAAACAWAALLLHRRGRFVALPLALAGMWRMGPASPEPRGAATGPAAEGPDIALVVLDTLRRDRCSTFGYPHETTPNLTALAERGVRFDAAWSTAPWSLPAHGSMFTGLMPEAHGAHNLHPSMPADRPLLVERLAAAGYQAAGFSANPFAGTGTGMARGYHWFEDHWRRFTLHEVLLGFRVRNGLFGVDRDKGGAAILEGVARWWAQRDPDRPAWLFVNFMEPHGPYQEVPLPWRSAFTEAPLTALERAGEAVHMAQIFNIPVDDVHQDLNDEVLDGCVLAADHYLGRVMEIVGPDTVVIALSDHGDMLGEKGYFGHNTGLWEPILRVPVVIAGPGIPEGQVVSDPISLVDIFPTVLGLAGVSAPQSDGVDLRPVMAGERSLAGRVVHAQHMRTVYTTSGWRSRHPFDDLEPHLAARTASITPLAKRILVEGGPDLGFDLVDDPDEEAPFDGALTGLR